VKQEIVNGMRRGDRVQSDYAGAYDVAIIYITLLAALLGRMDLLLELPRWDQLVASQTAAIRRNGTTNAEDVTDATCFACCNSGVW
jgi:hypothetical protein